MSDPEQEDRIDARIESVRARVAAASARCGRRPEDVSILPVTKNFGPAAVRAAAACGFSVFGENRVQEARVKIPLSPGHLRWHMVGHLQRNKVREAVQLFDMIHSVDSWRLLEALEEHADQAGRSLAVLLEVNLAGESSKYGFAPDDVPAILERCGRLLHLDVCGLMTLPPFAPDPEATRPFFRSLAEYRDRWAAETGFELAELSMGMSNDFEVAIEEGATWIRLGTTLFGARSGRWRPSEDELAEL